MRHSGFSFDHEPEKDTLSDEMCIAVVLTKAYGILISIIFTVERSENDMAKTSNLYARIEPEVKEQAETILSALGIPVSNAINMFYKQIILQRGIPFDMKLPQGSMQDISQLTERQLNAELEKGYDDIAAGRAKPARDVFDSIRKDHGI